jgi:hypothetical protein
VAAMASEREGAMVGGTKKLLMQVFQWFVPLPSDETSHKIPELTKFPIK